MLEENLRQLQEWLDGREENGILYQRTLNLSKERREQAERSIKEAFDLIETLSKKFGLEKESQNAASIFQGDLTINWANLIDVRSDKLKRYGAVHPHLAEALDADTNRLAEIALQLSSTINES